MTKEKELLQKIEALEAELDSINMYVSDASHEIRKLIDTADQPWLKSSLGDIQIILSGQIPIKYYG